jgi:hypothetical protein
LSENGDASREDILRARVCPNTVVRDGAATFSNQVRKGPAGEEQRKAYEKFQRDGCLCIAKRPGPSVERVARVREAFQRKFTNRASLELDIPQPTVWRILRKRLRFKPYRLQLLQALTDEDKTRRLQFCTDMLHHLEEYGFAENLIFSDKATFHLYGKVNRHNVRI